MPPQSEHAELKRLLELNNTLVAENTKLVKRMYRWTVANMVWKFLWVIILIGLPFALYFYILEPYFAAFGSNYETFMVGLGELPGLKGFDQLLNQTFGSSGE